MVGKLVKSKAGHDKDKIYLVVGEEQGYLYLADGTLRGINNPKKKKRKHIQPILKYEDSVLTEQLRSNQKVLDETIKRHIKISLNNRQEV